MGNYLQNVQAKREMENALRFEEEGTSVNRIKIDDDQAKILLVGDEHIGHQHHNRDKLMTNLEWAFDNGIYVLHMGDGIEGATRSSIGDGVYTQDEIFDEQISEWEALYKPFRDNKKFLGAHVGNHEARAFKDEGINVMRQMCRNIGGKYLGIGKAHLIRVGNQTYVMYTTHGASGARLTHTKIKSALDLEKIVDADVYACGHVHQLSHHVREFYKVDKRRKKLEREKKHFIITGSYLDYWGSYAQVKSMEPSRQGSPLLTLDGLTKQANVSIQ